MPPTFKFLVPSDYILLGIDKNDRGEWYFQSLFSCGCEFVGFGGENTLLILLAPMQSGHTHVAVVHAVVDSPTIYRETMNRPGKSLTKTINDLVAETLIYPETLPRGDWSLCSCGHIAQHHDKEGKCGAFDCTCTHYDGVCTPE